jgi:hypothetical protein
MKVASRYDAIIATLVGVLALTVSGYTAYVQRQQVRAQVWPYLLVGNGNVPNIRLMLANKGVGPAIIKNAIVRVDGKPVPDWDTMFERLGKKHERYYSSFGRRVVAAGEEITVLDLRNDKLEPVSTSSDKGTDDAYIWAALHDRVDAEICYCSSLGDCWIASDDGTRETARCPKPSADSFRN